MCKFITIKQFFEKDGKASGNTDIDCTLQITAVNRALAHIWHWIYDMPDMMVSEKVSGTQHTTQYPIYKVVGFYGKGGKSDEKGDCFDCGGIVKQSMVNATPSCSISQGEYTIPCFGGNSIIISPHCNVSDLCVVYTRYFNRLETENDEIPVPDYAIPLLTSTMSYYEAIKRGDFNIAQVYGQEIANYIKQIKISLQDYGMQSEMGFSHKYSKWN